MFLVFVALFGCIRPASADADPLVGGGSAAEHEIVREAWSLILETFPGRERCLSAHAPEVILRPFDHVGVYDFRIRTVILREGGFGIADAVHEFAHVLDWECGFDAGDEERLFAASGFPPYLRDAGWKYSPVEIFAEAVVKLVLGPEASSAGGRATGLHPGAEAQAVVVRWVGWSDPAAASSFPRMLIHVPL